MKNYVITLWQIITYPIVGFSLRIYHNAKTKINFKHKKGTHYIFAPNHPSEVDAFLIPYSLPFKTILKLVPFRFITTEAYMKLFLIGPILQLFGSITTKKTAKGTVLERATKLIQKGETIFIFPGGGLDKNNKEKKAKKGVAVLGKTIQNVEVIPVNIRYEKNPTRKATITYKEPVIMKRGVKNLQKEADKVYGIALRG